MSDEERLSPGANKLFSHIAGMMRKLMAGFLSSKEYDKRLYASIRQAERELSQEELGAVDRKITRFKKEIKFLPGKRINDEGEIVAQEPEKTPSRPIPPMRPIPPVRPRGIPPGWERTPGGPVRRPPNPHPNGPS
jgi:hypothetical protein